MREESQRDAVCDAYENDLKLSDAHPHLPIIARIGLRVSEGKRIALYCFCAPKRCHCLTIQHRALTYADWLKATSL
jgi:hypothetical protein